MASVRIQVFRWAGQWGPFKVKIPCGECALTQSIIDDVLNNELSGINVQLEVKDWLSFWWEPLFKGGWHAPIVMVEDKIVSQGEALNRGVLIQAVIEHYSRQVPIVGHHLFGKADCHHCHRAKGYLDKLGINYRYHDVVKDSRALYEMISRVKPEISSKTPVTVPQIWIDGEYIGGADQLKDAFSINY